MCVILPSIYLGLYHLVFEAAVVIHVFAIADGDVQLDVALQNRGRLTSTTRMKPHGEGSKAKAYGQRRAENNERPSGTHKAYSLLVRRDTVTYDCSEACYG